MLIGTLDQALAAIRVMNREEVNALTDLLEADGALHCSDRRRKRDFCKRVAILTWDVDRWEVIRCIYNAQAE